MILATERYLEQRERWPARGRHIVAHFDDESIVVYQAYRPAIARFAVENQRFGGEFSFTRMSWVKPNFLWMMYRSGWATKEGQERVLALRVRRAVFDRWLLACVPSSWSKTRFPDRQAWAEALASSSVRLQWDPDHDPTGGKVERRAVQLGLRGPCLASFAGGAFLSIDDVTGFVAEQREHRFPDRWSDLILPREQVYPVDDEAQRRLEMSRT